MDFQKKRKPGEAAYMHYLRTGDIYGQAEGAVIRGNGAAPENPMGLDLFLEQSRKLQPPSGKDTSDPWSAELVTKTLWSNPKITNKACDEGWICGLWDFVRDKHRLPKNHEFDKLRRDADYVRECAAGRENLGAMHGSLVGIAKAMMERRHKLAQEFKR